MGWLHQTEQGSLQKAIPGSGFIKAFNNLGRKIKEILTTQFTNETLISDVISPDPTTDG